MKTVSHPATVLWRIHGAGFVHLNLQMCVLHRKKISTDCFLNQQKVGKVGSKRGNRSVNIVVVDKQRRNIMLLSPLLSPGSVPDSVGRAAIQSQSRLFLWTAAFVLTKQNATHWLMLCSHSCFKGTQKTSLKEFGFFFYYYYFCQQCCFLCIVLLWTCWGKKSLIHSNLCHFGPEFVLN